MSEEVFDISTVEGATAKWPAARRAKRLFEAEHPATIPDTHEGPFRPKGGWVEDQFVMDSQMGDIGIVENDVGYEGPGHIEDEEIGYEGER